MLPNEKYMGVAPQNGSHPSFARLRSSLSGAFYSPVFYRYVNGEFCIHGIPVFILNAAKHPSHLFHERPVADQPLAGNIRHIEPPPHVAKSSLRVKIMLQQNFFR